jgi:hypothetical protein
LSATVLLAAAWFLRAPLFCGMARLLIVDQPIEDRDFVCVNSLVHRSESPRGNELIDELRRKGHTHKVLLLIGPGVERLVKTGVVPPFEAQSRQFLAEGGVPQEDISVLHSEGHSDRAFAQTLGAWLRVHSAATVLWACPRFRSANVRLVLDTVLDPAAAKRVRVQALRNSQGDETNWWTTRQSARAFGVAWLIRLQGWLGTDTAAPVAAMTADDYERSFLSGLKEQAP